MDFIKKISHIYELTLFFVSSGIFILFFLRVAQNQSLKDLFTLSTATLGIVGALSALSYAGSAHRQNVIQKKAFLKAGDRFFHCFIYAALSLFFAGAGLVVKIEGFLGYVHVILDKIAMTILAVLSISCVFKGGHSYRIGFNMIRLVFDQDFKLKDQDVFDDLNSL